MVNPTFRVRYTAGGARLATMYRPAGRLGTHLNPRRWTQAYAVLATPLHAQTKKPLARVVKSWQPNKADAQRYANTLKKAGRHRNVRVCKAQVVKNGNGNGNGKKRKAKK